jgi:hypothetical protein
MCESMCECVCVCVCVCVCGLSNVLGHKYTIGLTNNMQRGSLCVVACRFVCESTIVFELLVIHSVRLLVSSLPVCCPIVSVPLSVRLPVCPSVGLFVSL